MKREIVYAKLNRNVAEMRIDKYIGTPPPDQQTGIVPNIPHIDGPEFAAEMNFLYKSGKNILVKVNSDGGNVKHGWDIYESIESCEADTHCYGLAASMAAMCMLAGKKRTIEKHASMMFHAPSQPSGEPSPYGAQVTDGFKTLLETRTKLPKEKIDLIMGGGDHFFSAEDCDKYGIATMVDSKIRVAAPLNATYQQLQQFYATLNTEPTMETPAWLTALFGKQTDAENMTAAMKLKGELEAAKAENEKAKVEKTALEGRIAALEAAAKTVEVASVKDKAVALIDKAIADGKLVLDAAQKITMVDAAVKDFTSIELMVNSVQAAKVNSVVASIKAPDGKGDMTYAQMADKHPEMLAKIAEENPTLFNSLADAHLQATKKV